MTASFLARLTEILGPSGLLTADVDMKAYLEEERSLYRGEAVAVARPANTEQVAAVVALCAEHQVSIVPQGGNTGLCGGASPDTSGDQLVLSLGRMNKVRSVDPLNFTMTVEAGVILQTIQQRADAAGCLFPLSLGAEGSCQIGGNISTNAGGSGVLRYGNTRDLVLGLEVVLPDGQIWDGLRALRKDNTGYDLKQLFIGGEGTLGIITAAVIKLFPKPRDVSTAFCALETPDAVLSLLARARAATGDQVTAFEFLHRACLDLDLEHLPIQDPFSDAYPWYVLIELSTSRPDAALKDTLETLLGDAIEAGDVVDAVIANSIEQRNALWRIREGIPEAQKKAGGSIKHDISVPVSSVPEFLRRATPAIQAALPDARVIPFGHVGDGNIHYNLSQAKGGDKAAFLAQWEKANRIVHDIVVDLRGSISAEHGIGKLKKGELAHYKASLELDVMRKIKAALDPLGLMNPGKVL